MYNTILAIVENRIKDIKKGQKDVWTARKGPKNKVILENNYKYNLNIFW